MKPFSDLMSSIVEFFGVYYHLHFIYFIALSLVSSAIFYRLEPNHRFIDCLFMTTSAATMTGLTTIDVSTMGMPSQILLIVTILCGGTILFACIPPLIRRRFIAREIVRKRVDLDKAGSLLTELRALDAITRICFLYWFLVQFISFWVIPCSSS